MLSKQRHRIDPDPATGLLTRRERGDWRPLWRFPPKNAASWSGRSWSWCARSSRTFLTRPSRRCGITMPFSALVRVEAERTPRAGQLRDICIHAPFNSAEYQPTGSISNAVPEPQTIRPRCPQRHDSSNAPLWVHASFRFHFLALHHGTGFAPAVVPPTVLSFDKFSPKSILLASATSRASSFCA